MKRILLIAVTILMAVAPSWAMKQKLINSSPAAQTSTTAARYMPLNGALWMSTSVTANNVMPTDGTLRNLYVKLSAAPDSTGNHDNGYIICVRVDGTTDSLLTVTIDGDDTQAAITSYDLAVTAGTRYGIKISPKGTPDTAVYVYTIVEFEGANAAESVLLGNGDSLTTGATTEYIAALAAGPDTATEGDATTVMPIAGTITKFYARLSDAPNGTNTRTFNVRINGVNQGTGLTFTGTDVVMNESLSVAVAAGDLIAICEVTTGTPAAARVATGITFEPTVPGYFPIARPGTTDTTAGQTRYFGIADGVNAQATDTGIKAIGYDDYSITGMYAYSPTAQGAGKTLVLTLLENSTPTTATVTYSNESGVKSVSGLSIMPAQWNYYVTSAVLSAGGTTAGIAVSYVGYIAGGAPPTLLTAPTLSSPADTSTGVSTSSSLSWSDTNTSPNETNYYVRIKAGAGSYQYYTAAADATSVSAATAFGSALSNSTTYSWSVQAKGDGSTTSDSDWPTDRTFTTEAGAGQSPKRHRIIGAGLF